MSVLHTVWATPMVYLLPPLRLVIFLALAVLVLFKAAPLLLRLCGACLERSGPALALLTYPEFLATSAARRLGRPPVPGTFGYDRLLGVLHTGLVAVGRALSRLGRLRPRHGGATFAMGAAAALAVWYSAAALPPGEFGDAVRLARTGLVAMDVWLMAGATVPAGTVCPAVPVRPKPVPRHPVAPRPPASSIRR